MQRVFHRTVLGVIIGVLILVACQSEEETPTPVPPATPAAQAAATTAASAATSPLAAAESPLSAASSSPLAAPVDIPEGRARLQGRLLSEQTGQPLVKGLVRLAEVYCPEGIEIKDKSEECFWALDNAFSPSTFTDENGFFVFEDTEARDYVILVGDLLGAHTFVFGEPEKPIIFTTTADEVLDVGEHSVDYQ